MVRESPVLKQLISLSNKVFSENVESGTKFMLSELPKFGSKYFFFIWDGLQALWEATSCFHQGLFENWQPYFLCVFIHLKNYDKFTRILWLDYYLKTISSDSELFMEIERLGCTVHKFMSWKELWNNNRQKSKCADIWENLQDDIIFQPVMDQIISARSDMSLRWPYLVVKNLLYIHSKREDPDWIVWYTS